MSKDGFLLSNNKLGDIIFCCRLKNHLQHQTILKTTRIALMKKKVAVIALLLHFVGMILYSNTVIIKNYLRIKLKCL